MKFLRTPLVLLLVLAVAVAALLWFNRPSPVDLAKYAPADSLLYVELNKPSDVARAIQQTDVWKAAAPITQTKAPSENKLAMLAARAGIGPIDAVLFSRSQVALAVVGLNTAEQDDTLRVKPEFALIVETHTSAWRTKPVVMDAVKQLASFVYGASNCSERSADAEYVECSVAGGERKIVGAVDGTLVVVGNTENAVRGVLEAKRGTRPNLLTDPEMVRVRSRLASDQTLGFGYISAANSAKLFSWAAPLMMRRGPSDRQLEQLLEVSAGKILRGVAWTVVPNGGGLEDRYLVSLEPDVVSRLQPAFDTAQRDEDFWKLVPDGFESLTIYRSKEPAVAWRSLDAAVALKLEALPAVLFGTILRSSLTPYGIGDPKEVLTTLAPPLLTLRPSAAVEGSVLVARVTDEARLRRSLAQDVFKGNNGQIVQGLQAELDPELEYSAVFSDGYVLLGRTENMQPCLAALRRSAANSEDKIKQASQESSAAIVTYANDEMRLRNFISTLLMLQGRRLSAEEIAGLNNSLRDYSFSSTETRLGSGGIERKTRSAFGQFSTFVSMLGADSPSVVAR
ncbi:MAG TPA: hypothetical protein VFM63_13650 [Pyrinomonadaceae bacterium]|nr:hypothetical protein [Pyrinomonadaceae bacterium]